MSEKNEIKDLDILFPDDKERFKFTGRKDGAKYVITMFIPHGVSLYMSSKDDKPAAERQLKTLAFFLKAQHKNMNEEWIKENLSAQKQNMIFNEIIKEVGKSNDFLSEDATQKMIMDIATKIVEKTIEGEEAQANPELRPEKTKMLS